MKISAKQNKSVLIKILVSLPLIALLYFLLAQYKEIGIFSASLQDPHSLKTIVDDWIPFIPWFLAPYLLWGLFPVASLIFAFRKKISVIDMSSMYITHILLLFACFVAYVIFPTTAESVMIDTSLFDHQLIPNIGELQKLYGIGTPFNAFPSYHVAPMVFISFFLFRKWRKLFWANLPLTIAIITSTVFIKYHFFLDVLGGIAMGTLAYYILYEEVVLKIIGKLKK